MVRMLLVTTLVACLFVAFAAAQESELRALAKERDVTVQINAEYEPATFEMLVSEADTVVVGKVIRGRTFLQGGRLATHYDVGVEQVIRRKPPGLTRGNVLIVHGRGGSMTLGEA